MTDCDPYNSSAVFVTMRTHLAAVALASLLALSATAQSPAATPIGTWRGTSVCLVHPSPCHDEVVVYRITNTKSPDSAAIDAKKIVGGEEQDMGLLACRLLPAGLTCALPQAVWLFSVRGDSLVGELRRRDNTKFRDVRAIRAPN